MQENVLENLVNQSKKVYTTHKNKNVKTDTPKKDHRGSKRGGKYPTAKDFLRRHIEAFPTVHECIKDILAFSKTTYSKIFNYEYMVHRALQ